MKIAILLFIFVLTFQNIFAQDILNKSPIIFNITASQDSVCPGDSILFTASVTGGDGGPYTFFDYSSTQINFPYIFQAFITGNFTVTAYDNSGNQATDNINITVHSYSYCSVIPDTLRGCNNLTVHFQNSCLSQSNNTYLWDFGDNNFSTLLNPIHYYDQIGSKTVTLTTTTQYGCISIYSYHDLIQIFPIPYSNFTFSPTISEINDTIQFSNLSQNSSNCYWDFGDGTFSDSINPSHVYNNNGNYYVTLIAYSDYFRTCSDTSTILKTVDVDEIYINNNIKLYPNPVKDELTIETPEEIELKIINSIGQSVINISTTDKVNKINTKQFSKGIYTVQILEFNEMTEIKFIKE